MKFKKGDKKPKAAGRKKGTPNKKTIEFKEALNNLLQYCVPEMLIWLKAVAADDPYKALGMMKDLAEFIHPKLSRTESRFTGSLTLPRERYVKSKSLEEAQARLDELNSTKG